MHSWRNRSVCCQMVTTKAHRSTHVDGPSRSPISTVDPILCSLDDPLFRGDPQPFKSDLRRNMLRTYLLDKASIASSHRQARWSSPEATRTADGVGMVLIGAQARTSKRRPASSVPMPPGLSTSSSACLKALIPSIILFAATTSRSCGYQRRRNFQIVSGFISVSDARIAARAAPSRSRSRKLSPFEELTRAECRASVLNVRKSRCREDVCHRRAIATSGPGRRRFVQGGRH